MISLETNMALVTAEHVRGPFFEDWPQKPTQETLLRILRGSTRAVVAIDDEVDEMVGFITALSDGVLMAYIPLLEVLPHYRLRGIGSMLVERMVDELRPLYAIDLSCDPGLQSFYARLGFKPSTGMLIRDYTVQSGRVLAK